MPMWWKDKEFENPSHGFNEDHFAHYQRAVAVRNHLPALRTGFFRPLVIDDERGLYGFVRDSSHHPAVYVVLNRSDRVARVQIPIGSEDHDVSLLDWMNPDHADVLQPAADQPDARPTMIGKPGAAVYPASRGRATIELKPYGTAVLTRVKGP
jgi:hypothetical protein